MPGIQYRFGHERVWHPLEFEGTKIHVTQLRDQIAKNCGLEKDSNRRLTIRLSEAQTSKEFTDNDMISVGSQVIAQRVPIYQIDVIKHTAKTHFTASELKPNESEKNKKPPLPQPYICDICHYVLEKPVQLRCTGKCNGKTVCRSHLEEYLTQNPTRPRLSCPLDGPKATMGTPYAIPNKRVARMLQTMNFDAFEFPKRPPKGSSIPTRFPGVGANDGPDTDTGTKNSTGTTAQPHMYSSQDSGLPSAANSYQPGSSQCPPHVGQSMGVDGGGDLPPQPSNQVTHQSVPAAGSVPMEIVLSYNPFVEYIGCLPFLSVNRFRHLKQKQVSAKRKLARKLLSGVMGYVGIAGSTASSSHIGKTERRGSSSDRRKKKEKKLKKRKKEKDKSHKSRRSKKKQDADDMRSTPAVDDVAECAVTEATVAQVSQDEVKEREQ